MNVRYECVLWMCVMDVCYGCDMVDAYLGVWLLMRIWECG